MWPHGQSHRVIDAAPKEKSVNRKDRYKQVYAQSRKTSAVAMRRAGWSEKMIRDNIDFVARADAISAAQSNDLQDGWYICKTIDGNFSMRAIVRGHLDPGYSYVNRISHIASSTPVAWIEYGWTTPRPEIDLRHLTDDQLSSIPGYDIDAAKWSKRVGSIVREWSVSGKVVAIEVMPPDGAIGYSASPDGVPSKLIDLLVVATGAQ